MKIAFDQQVFLLQEYGGISRYFCSMAQELDNHEETDARIIAPIHFNKNLSALNTNRNTGYLLPQLHPKLLRLSMEASKFMARRAINKFAPDILHETYFSYDDYQPRGAKRVLTVYDFIHERYSSTFEHSDMTAGPKKAAALRADHVICISESTRLDLIKYCGVPDHKISVVYLAADEIFHQKNASPDKHHKGDRPYFLFVGKRDGYKNFDKFVHSFSRSDRLKSDFDIVCFGGGPLTEVEQTFAKERGLRPDQIAQYGGADEILAQLYQNAVAFVYPSLYEGFGIPPLEAMAAGCPVISSDTSSLPEVIGDAGEYFNPLDEESILTALERVAYSNTHRDDLIKRGHLQEPKFSWKRCAEETQAIYRSLL